MKVVILSIFIVLSSFSSFSQEIYSPLESQGELPKDIQLLFSEKYKQEYEKLEQKDPDYKKKKDFILNSNHNLDQIFKGGQLLFNDEISNYVNSLVDIIKKANPKIPKALRFFVMRSTASNAFSTNQGVIVVTSGLISQCENEAQIAFILCHEISHYIKQHTIESYLENKENIKNLKRGGKYDQYVALMSKYSKNQEFEADDIGFSYFINTDYDPYEAITAFNVLHYSYLPFNEVPFDPNYFQSEYFTVRPGLHLDSINPIDVLSEDYDDSKSSHPNIWKRKNKLLGILDDYPSTNVWFIEGKDKFNAVQKLCRKESIRLNLLQGDYASAIYSAYIMQLEDSSDPYYEISIAKALYGLHEHNSFKRLREVLPLTKKTEGESSKLYYFLNKLSDEELAVLAIRSTFQVAQKFPENLHLKNLWKDALYDLVFEHAKIKEDFLTKFPEPDVLSLDSLNVDSLISEVKTEESTLSRRRSGKYARITEAKTEDTVKSSKEDNISSEITDSTLSYQTGFIDMLKEESFNSYFEEISSEFITKLEEELKLTYWDKRKKKLLERKADKKKWKNIWKNGTSLGLEKASIYMPFVADFTSKGKQQFLEQEASELSLVSCLKEQLVERELDYNLLSFNGDGNVDVDFYNTIARVSAWAHEAYLLEEREVNMILLEGEYLPQKEKLLKSDYLVFTGVISAPEKRYIDLDTWYYSTLLFPTLPITATLAIVPKKHLYHYIKVYDIRTGEVVHRTNRDLKVKLNDTILKGISYDTIQQLSRKRK